MKTIKIYYWNGASNFGDLINVDLLEAVFNLKAIRCEPLKCDMMGIGSLLGKIVDKKRFRLSRLFPQSPLHICGTGFIRNLENYSKLKRPVIVHSIRGYHSLEQLKKLTGQPLDNVAFGDPGLFAPALLKNTPNKQYKLGIIPHHSEREQPVFRHIENAIKHSKIIDVAMPPTEVVKEIAKCEAVLSTSLHGLITADSFGIPNQWAVASNFLHGGDYKFFDYYSVFDIKPTAFDLRQKAFTDKDISDIHANYEIKHDDVERIKRDLFVAFPESLK